MANLWIFLIFGAFAFSSILCDQAQIEAYSKKFNPRKLQDGDHIARQYPRHRIEVTSSFGLTEPTILFLEAVIEQHFTGKFDTEAMNLMQTEIQQIMGGYWGIQFFESPYLFFSTAFRRSSSFIVFDVDGAGIAIVKEL
uniref:Uncharacterized protein n=1 Tax=Caenorhabditis japonica TaxID=281687 RepID=A0A8R1E9H8_CAEJA